MAKISPGFTLAEDYFRASGQRRMVEGAQASGGPGRADENGSGDPS